MREPLHFTMHDPYVTLADILTVLPGRVIKTAWVVEPYVEPNGEEYFEVASMGDDPITPLAGTEVRFPHGDFQRAAADTPQVIWGTFKGYDEGPNPQPWLTIRAVDSSWWEVETDDLATRRLVRTRFKNVKKGRI